MPDFAVIAFCTIIGGLSIFQMALLFGAPFGRFAWGGAHEILPVKLRIGSAVSIILYSLFILIILNKVHILTLFSKEATSSIMTWILVAYFALGILMNAISRSNPERYLMTPIATALMLLTLIIALR
jgi:hypothetical protein